jgi:hypothetical protein
MIMVKCFSHPLTEKEHTQQCYLELNAGMSDVTFMNGATAVFA